VDQGVRGGEELLAVVGVVVSVSVVAHGATATPFSGWYARKAEQETLAEERASTAAGLFTHAPDDVPRVTPDQLAQRLAGPDPPLVLDVRSRSEHERDGVRIPGSIRVLPDQVTEWVADRSAISRSCWTAPDRGSRPAPVRRYSSTAWASRPRRCKGPERLARQPSRGTTTDAA
jgi:NhaP-type Na+/H+ or K+/H+ antiporter